jgi:putative flippase GtrA
MPFFRSAEIKLLFDTHRTKILFLVVGAWNTLFGFGAFILLYKLFVHFFRVDYFAYTSAQVLSTIVSIINAFICHKYITFRSKAKGTKMIFEFMRFSTTYLVVFLLGLVLMPLLVEALKIQPIVAAVILNVIVIFTSYFGHSRFSFFKTTP